jgi:hypothetical protein
MELVEHAGKLKPGLILFPDSDETFSPNVVYDIDKFEQSDANLLLFRTEMVTVDNREVKTYPKMRHCKVFKWEKGINYSPYRNYAIPNVKNGRIMKAASPILHWCFYTRHMEQNKRLHN